MNLNLARYCPPDWDDPEIAAFERTLLEIDELPETDEPA